MMIDPRGPRRKILSVRWNVGGLTAVGLECGHTRGLNPIYFYKVGMYVHCLACYDEQTLPKIGEAN